MCSTIRGTSVPECRSSSPPAGRARQMQRSPMQWLNVVAFLVCWHGKLGVRAELSPPASTRRMACMTRERTQKAWRTGCQSEGSNERERADTGAHPQGWLGAGWLQAASGKQFADCLTECVKALGDEELDHTKLFACSSRFPSGSACVLLRGQKAAVACKFPLRPGLARRRHPPM